MSNCSSNMHTLIIVSLLSVRIMDHGKHVVMVPHLGQGHMIPFLALARLIDQRTPTTTTITLVSTPLNIIKLRESLPSDTNIRLAELPFSSSDHGLPPDTENTDSTPPHLLAALVIASETLHPSFELLLSALTKRHGRENICIIGDVFLGWTAEAAEKLGVFHFAFVTSGAYGAAIFSSLVLHTPRLVHDEDVSVPLSDFPEIEVHKSVITDPVISDEAANAFFRMNLSRTFRSCRGLLVNTVSELEKGGLSLLKRYPGLPVWTVGPVCISSPPRSLLSSTIKEWLDWKPPASVVYVSFGSQLSIHASQMMELAMGLEASGLPFIWVVRPPVEIQEANLELEWLPEGFEKRMREKLQGIIMRLWAPQMEILSHASTGVFVSHCGWNSVIESLSEGVPIVGWPLTGDQLYNCKMLVEEMGVCVEVARGMGGDALSGGWRAVERTVRAVVCETEMRRRVGEIKEVLRAAVREDGGQMGSSIRALQDFLQAARLEMRPLRNGCK